LEGCAVVLVYVPPGLVVLLDLLAALPFLLLAAVTLGHAGRALPRLRELLPAHRSALLVLGAAAAGAVGGQLVALMPGLGGDPPGWLVPATGLALGTSVVGWTGSRARRAVLGAAVPVIAGTLLLSASISFAATTMTPFDHRTGGGTAGIAITGGLDPASGDAPANCTQAPPGGESTVSATLHLHGPTAVPSPVVLRASLSLAEGGPERLQIVRENEGGRAIWSGYLARTTGSTWRTGEATFDLPLDGADTPDANQRLSGTFTWSCDRA
jgi:hypothetical protein